MNRTVLLVGAMAAFVVVSKLLVENVLGVDIAPALRHWIANPGLGSAAVIAGLLAADILLPIPSSLVMLLSGAAFGVTWGSVVALAGSIGGEWVGFEVARRYGRPAAARLVGDDDIDRLSSVFARHGIAAVIVTRALPVVMETTSVVAGLSRMGRLPFLAASVAGTAPIVVIYAWAGAASRDAGSLVPAVVIAIAMAGLGAILYRARVSR